MKAQVKNYYQEFVDEIRFPTIIYIYETGKVISYNKQALEMFGKPVVNVNRMRAANPGLVMTDRMLENQSTVLYNQRFCAGNGVIIEIDCEINSIRLQDRHLQIIFFEYSFKQVFCHRYSKLLPRITWMNKAYDVLGYNEPFKREQGYSEQEKLPSRIEEFLDEQTTSHILQECGRLLGSKKPVFNIIQLLQPYRAMSYFCKMNCVPIYNKNDTVVGMLMIYMLVFNREEYEQFFSTSLRENNILNQMICNTNMIVISWSKDIRYQIQYVSSNISNLGYTSEECYTGKVGFSNLMSKEVLYHFYQNIHEIENGPQNCFNQQMQIRRADGSLCWVTVYVGINKRSNKSFFYECFIQELMSESSYRVREKENIFHMTLPMYTKDIKELLESKKNEFCTYYQPVFSVGTGKIIAVEAVLRLQRGTDDVVAPEEVLTPAEAMALRVPLGEWFVQNAITEFVKLKKHSKHPVALYIEVASLQLIHPNYAKTIRLIAMEQGVDPEEIVLELKESIAAENVQLLAEVIKEYKAEGFRVVLTGFLGGAFSLHRLKEFKIDGIKYNKEVVNAYYNHEIAAKIFEQEVEYINTLGIQVLLDGVETKQHYGTLAVKKAYGCQGSYFSVPLSYEDMTRRIRDDE